MSKILVIPNEKTEYVLSNKEVEILVLNKNMKRLDIKYAPALKKIISLNRGDVTFGPEELTATIPVLNNCKNLNEIVTFGNIKFNTMIATNGKEIVSAWTSVNGVPPTITSVGHEYINEVPFFYYDTKAPIEDADTSLIYAYPAFRYCPTELFDDFLNGILKKPDEVSKAILHNQMIKRRV